MTASEVVVVGAGPAGLAAALETARAGHPTTVIEAGDRVGGMAASIEVAGQRVDLGSHRLHPAAPAPILELVGQLLGDDLQIRPRRGRIRLADRWIGFPLRAGDLVRQLPPRMALDLAVDTATGPLRSPPGPGDDSFAAVVERRFGSTIADAFYRPYATKLYGLPPEELDAELARRRIAATSGAAVLKRVARAARPSGRTFLYPRRGFGQLVERLAEAAVEAGTELVLAAPVGRITTGAGAARPGVRAADGSWRRPADVVLSTLPLPLLTTIVDPPAPPPVLAAARRLRTRAMVLVYLVLDRPRYTPFDAHYLPGTDTVVARLSEPRNYRDGPDPTDRTVLCAEIPCWVDDEVWTAGDLELGRAVVDELRALGLPPADPVEVEVRRLRSVYPVYERSTAADRRALERWASGLDGVVTLGRQGLAAPDNVHHVLDMGLRAARAVTAGPASKGGDEPFDRVRWGRDLDRFAGHVVED